MSNISFARSGEDLAVELLKKKGYKILSRNYRCLFGEIDVVAKQDNTVCFVEVKAHRGNNFAYPAESINSKKKQHIFRCANEYLKKNKLIESPSRFDAVLIAGGKTHLIKNAFSTDEIC